MNKKISDVLKGTEFEDIVEVLESANYKTIGDIFNKTKFGGSVLSLFNTLLDDFIDDKKQKIKLIGILQREVDQHQKSHMFNNTILPIIIIVVIFCLIVISSAF